MCFRSSNVNWFMWCAHRGWFSSKKKKQSGEKCANWIKFDNKMFRSSFVFILCEVMDFRFSQWNVELRKARQSVVVIVKGKCVCRNQTFKFEAFSIKNIIWPKFRRNYECENRNAKQSSTRRKSSEKILRHRMNEHSINSRPSYFQPLAMRFMFRKRRASTTSVADAKYLHTSLSHRLQCDVERESEKERDIEELTNCEIEFARCIKKSVQ